MVPSETRTVVVERDLDYPVEQVWEALTRPDVLKDWLMPSEFCPQVGHAFSFSAEWRVKASGMRVSMAARVRPGKGEPRRAADLCNGAGWMTGSTRNMEVKATLEQVWTALTEGSQFH